MSDSNRQPGVSREQRVSDDGLERLEKHLKLGTRINPQVLKQWIRRYGKPAEALIRQYNQYSSELDSL